ncbi:MAG: FAD-dependent oxidoreductase, partial [Gemmatimonadota bacterium]
MSERRIGVYICHCGGNISDYVDVAKVRDAVADEPGVVHAETTMFACSDGSQHDMIQKIQDEHLDGLVVASCSPKLHLHTFRGVSKRAGLNPFEYTQVNIREQDSWAHGDDPVGATRKAIGLIRAGIAKTRASEPLEPIGVETTSGALVVGGGIAGLRAAIGLADIGLAVTLVEREAELGGWVGRLGPMFPHERSGRDLVANLVAEVRKRPGITVFTRAELVGKSGSFGNYHAELRVTPPDGGAPETVPVDVGSIVIATGFDTYQPEAGEYGYGIDGVLTLPEFKELVDAAPGPLRYKDRPVGTIAYIYCVGNRQEGGNAYCSKYCCSAAVHESIQVSRHDVAARQYHLYRDIRTYGR